MATKTKSKIDPLAAWRGLAEAGERALDRIVDGESLLPEDHEAISFLGWSDAEFEARVSRRRRYRQALEGSVTRADLDEARQKLADTKETTAEDIAALEAEIKRLQNEISEKREFVEAAESEVRRIENERDHVKQHAPESIQRRFRDLRQDVENGIGKKCRELKQRIAMIKDVLSLPRGSERLELHLKTTFRVGHPRHPHYNAQLHQWEFPGLDDYLCELREELPEAEEEFSKLDEERKEQFAAIDLEFETELGIA